MIRERAMQLVAALRSGKYKQGVNALHQDDTFCCLGVACDIAGAKWELSLTSKYGIPLYNDGTGALERSIMPNYIRDYFGFATAEGQFEAHAPALWGRQSLLRANDAGATFDQIADYIEANWETL